MEHGERKISGLIGCGGVNKGKQTKMTPGVLAWAIGRIELPLTEMGKAISRMVVGGKPPVQFWTC